MTTNNPLPTPPTPPPQNGFNWLAFFQSLDTKYGRIAIFGSIISFGYGAGYISAQLVKDREIVKMERDYNDLKYELNSQKIQFERERSDSKVEQNQLKITIINLSDSIRNGRKK